MYFFIFLYKQIKMKYNQTNMLNNQKWKGICMAKISVIVPVFNSERYLPQCIESILKQTFYDFEVIFINDGSKDNSVSVIKGYNDERIKIINQENQGQAVARNNAIKEAKGEYITFVDSDDCISFCMLEKLYEKAKNTNADICWCDMSTFNDNMKVREVKEFINLSDEKKDYIIHNAGPCAKLIRKEIIIDNELYFLTNHFYEDIAVVPAYSLFADKISYIDDSFYNYRIHNGSTMKQKTYSKKMEDIFESMEHLYSYFKDEKYYENEIEFLYIKHLLHAASLRFFNFSEGRDQIVKISNIMKEKFPKWYKNKYFQMKDIRFKIICLLIYKKKFFVLSLLLK